MSAGSTVSFVEAIAGKRDGGELSRSEIARFVAGASDGSLPTEQLAAMLMAVCIRGMSPVETAALTAEMLDSGERWRLGELRPQVVDKHSTGGVGDTVSLVFAPLLAAVGVPVAMMAGRGLGHSQGTLDKLEAMPGFRVERDRAQLLELLDRCGAAIVAQTARIAPADRVLYALRDVTATVPSLPLIVASIMSKKLALGSARLVLDVKWGRGAFRPTVAAAHELATALTGVAHDAGVGCRALVTDMNQPLASALGTACEVRAARAVLAGHGEPRLREVTLALGVEALAFEGAAPEAARQRLEAALDGGAALAAWDELVRAHGGDPDPDRLPRPTAEHPVPAVATGWVQGIDAEALGWLAVEVGAGRRRRDEPIAHGAGLIVHRRIGDRVEAGEPLATVLVGERDVDVAALTERVRRAFDLGREPVPSPPLVVAALPAGG